MKYKIRYFTIKELAVLFLGHVFHKILQKINYKQKILLKNEIYYLLDEKFKIKRKRDSFILSKPGWYGNKQIFFRPSTSDIPVLRQVLIEKEYLPIINLVKEKTAFDSIKFIIDAGSNIGLTAIFLNSHFTDAKIIAIEPDESNFNQLLKNIEINNLESKIISLNSALWVNNNDNLAVGNKFRDGGPWAKTVEQNQNNNQNKLVKPFTLNELINTYSKNTQIDILKMDVEGTEAILFKSQDFLDTLSKRVRFFCFEIHKEFMPPNYYFEILKKINFEFLNCGETTFCYNRFFFNP